MTVTRRNFLLFTGAALALAPGAAGAQADMPSAGAIERQLQAAPQMMPPKPLTVPEIKRNPRMRRMAPSIDIQAINFRSGSAAIDPGEYWKLERIGTALDRILWDNPDEVFLIEGHTDAVGSRGSNQVLSERRALSLARALRVEFGIPRQSLEAAGYGEDFLLVQTSAANWRNRRVTIRRITDFLR